MTKIIKKKATVQSTLPTSSWHANKNEKAANRQSKVLKLLDKIHVVSLFRAYCNRVENYSYCLLSLLQKHSKKCKEGKLKNVTQIEVFKWQIDLEVKKYCYTELSGRYDDI